MVAKRVSIALMLLLGILAQGQNLELARRIQAQVLGVDSHNDTMQRVLIEKVDALSMFYCRAFRRLS